MMRQHLLVMGLFTTSLIMFLGATQGFAGDSLQFKSGTFAIEQLQELGVKSSQPTPRLQRAATEDVEGQYLTPEKTSYFIVQFDRVISLMDQEQIEALGIAVLRYIPQDAYIVRADASKMNQLKSVNSHVREFVPYHPELRLSSELRLRNVFNSQQTKTVRLELFPGVDAQRVASDLMTSGVLVLEVTPNLLVVQAKVKDLNRLSQIEGVEWLSVPSQMKLRNFILPNNLDDGQNPAAPVSAGYGELTGYESGTRIMNFEKAWSLGYKGGGQIVGVADTGLDTGDTATLFSDFANHKNSFILGYGSRSWADFQGHGTHVMGSVGSVGAGSSGTITGGATEAKLVAQSLWSTTHNTLTTPNDLQVIYKQAYQAGVRVHSNSWGDPSAHGVYNTETSQVDQFVWDHPEMVILFAAGNDGVDMDADGHIDPGSVSAPATAKNIISVGASENLVHKGGIQMKLGEIKFDYGKPWAAEPIASDTMSNDPNGIVAFSSRGPTSDGRIKPDIVAPGSNILSNCSHAEGAEVLWGRFNEHYCYSGGTSMSTPLVAGAAAVVRQKLMTSAQSNPSGALVKAVMLHTAVDLYPGQYGEGGAAQGQELLKRGANFDQGYGRMDVSAAVDGEYVMADEKGGLATGEIKNFVVQGRLKKVTLVYTDAPGAPTAQTALVNNLDLEVTVDGFVIGDSRSKVDNTEQVVLDKATPRATIVVRGANVAMGRNGKQPYALVYSVE